MRKYAVTFKYRVQGMLDGRYRRFDEPLVVVATNASTAAIKVREIYLRKGAVEEVVIEKVQPFEEIDESITAVQRVRGIAESGNPEIVSRQWVDGLSYTQYVSMLELLEAVARGERIDELKDALALPGILED